MARFSAQHCYWFSQYRFLINPFANKNISIAAISNYFSQHLLEDPAAPGEDPEEPVPPVV